jgi:tRNA(Ile)-lysidine synthase
VNPAVCETLAQSAEIARAEEDYWNKEVGRVLPEIWSCDDQGGTLKLSSRSLPLALRRRLLRAAADDLGIALEFRHVEEILGNGSGKGASVLSGEWTVKRHNDLITFGSVDQGVSEYQYDLPVPGKVTVTEAGVILETSLLAGANRLEKDDVVVDPRFARHKWVVRNWRPGERFWPRHIREPKKIKELLQDRHITGERKQRWPVIACRDEIIWLNGFGVRRDLQVNEGDGVLIRQIQGTDK